MIDLVGIDLGQHAGEEVRLLLIIAFEDDAVARREQRFEHGDHVALLQHGAARVLAHGVEAAALLGAPRIPLFLPLRWRCCGG
ncbi:hypothetical protein D3C71_751320 [compost metagenome]